MSYQLGFARKSASHDEFRAVKQKNSIAKENETKALVCETCKL